MSKTTHKYQPKTGILLVNLGSPEQPTTACVARYLREFLWDTRVVEAPRILWWCILHCIIVPFRSPKVAKLYKNVFTDEGAPLVTGTARLTHALAEKMHASCAGYTNSIIIDYAMRYGNPTIASVLDKMRAQHITRLLVLPLYPQYAASTTASVFDTVSTTLRQWRWVPELHFIHSYHDYMPYIQALAHNIRLSFDPTKHLLFSFHGLPLAMLQAGDPYYCHCHKTARLLAQELNLQPHQWHMTFQSRFGRQPWLQPYTDKVLAMLPQHDVKQVQITCPGFAIDCLETLEEIAEENQEIFMKAGGTQYTYIPCLNHNQVHVQAIHKLLMHQLTHWEALDCQRAKTHTNDTQQQLYEHATKILAGNTAYKKT